MSFPENNENEFDIEYISTTPGELGWISADSFRFTENGDLYLNGKGKVLKNPNKHGLFVFELSNDDAKLTLNISIISNEGLQKILSYRDRSFRELLTIARTSIENKTDFIKLIQTNEEDEDEYDDGYNNIQIDEVITEYTNLFTENLINRLYNIHVGEDKAGDIVDDMLSGLFGDSSTKNTSYNDVENDPEFYTETTNNDSKQLLTLDELNKLQPSPSEAEFNEYSLDDKDKNNFTIEEFINDIAKKTGISDINEEPKNPLNPNISELSQCIKIIYECFKINTKKEIIEKNEEFNNILDLIFETYSYKNKEKFIEPELFFINTITKRIYENTDEIIYDINEIEIFLKEECDFLLDILNLNEPQDSPFRKHIKIKYGMKKSLSEYIIFFNTLKDKIRLEFNNKVDCDITIQFFTCICALIYSINKLRIKIKNDIEVKNNQDREHYDKIKEYEEKILKLCEDVMSKILKYADEGIG